jgi:hypothetical protein
VWLHTGEEKTFQRFSHLQSFETELRLRFLRPSNLVPIDMAIVMAKEFLGRLKGELRVLEGEGIRAKILLAFLVTQQARLIMPWHIC